MFVMRASKIASLTALIVGVAWLLKVILIWAGGGANTDGGLVAVSYFVGVAALAVALLTGGYAVVARAPVWLRAVVSVATLLLGWILFTSIDSAAKGVYSADGWFRDELGILICALVALVVGGIGFRRVKAAAPPVPRHGGHRASR